MVTIRLARSGAKRRPFYHIVVTDRRNRRDGSYLERLGYFNPVATGQELRLKLDSSRVDEWVRTGAQVSERVKNLMKEVATQGEDGAVKARPKKDPGAKPAPAPKEAPAEKAKTEEAPAEEPKAEEAPAEEAKAEEAPAEEAKAEEAPAEETKAEEASAEEPKAEESKADESAAEGEDKAESAPDEGEDKQ